MRIEIFDVAEPNGETDEVGIDNSDDTQLRDIFRAAYHLLYYCAELFHAQDIDQEDFDGLLDDLFNAVDTETDKIFEDDYDSKLADYVIEGFKNKKNTKE